MFYQQTGGQQMNQRLAVHVLSSFFISSKGEMVMRTIQSEFIGKGLKQVDRDELRNRQANISNKQKETFSRRELEDLMGCNRPTYRRVGGAVRNKR